MPSNIQLNNTINWVMPFLQNRSLTLGASNEPAISSANTILQTILSAPFAWRWNRSIVSFEVTNLKQDYLVNVPDFGYMEKAVVTLKGAPAPNTFEIDTKNILGQASEQGRPNAVATQIDDGAGNMTFRVIPYPDQAYTVTITYQRAAATFSNITSKWAPIPDSFSYIFNWGFLALMMMYSDDARFPVVNSKFVSSLLGVSEGLSEVEKNTFMENWLELTEQRTSRNFKTQQGVQARGA